MLATRWCLNGSLHGNINLLCSCYIMLLLYILHDNDCTIVVAEYSYIIIMTLKDRACYLCAKLYG